MKHVVSSCNLLKIVLIILLLACCGLTSLHADPIVNKQINAEAFLNDVRQSHRLRVNLRITEQQFIEMAQEPGTIVLDARSADRFQEMHIAGARNLPFTDFTEESLKEIIPTKESKILIYCNNNIKNAAKAFPKKAAAASLNLSTYPALYTYGYLNTYELGPVIDPAKSKIKFSGTLVKSEVEEQPETLAGKCLQHGESSSIGGVPGPTGWTLDPPCCQGLIDREAIHVCGTAYAGGYVYACLKCGDQVCDQKVENNCNCPEDCKAIP